MKTFFQNILWKFLNIFCIYVLLISQNFAIWFSPNMYAKYWINFAQEYQWSIVHHVSLIKEFFCWLTLFRLTMRRIVFWLLLLGLVNTCEMNINSLSWNLNLILWITTAPSNTCIHQVSYNGSHTKEEIGSICKKIWCILYVNKNIFK